MPLPTRRIVEVLLGVLLIAGLATALVMGFLHEQKLNDAKTHCNLLQSPQEVSQALKEHPELKKEFEAIGSSVQVKQTEACNGNKAIVTVTYATANEKKAIEQKLAEGPYFGTAAEVIKAG
ncbi:MAG: hypothetical protein Q3974_01305 [Rothia sp. (in: high G+C Gram-positive bacteria)]|nr:hypothetical protein [Rothia sp. (in: high G+C Gram-positive bacteria)]